MVQHWRDILDMSTVARVRNLLGGVKSTSDDKIQELIETYSRSFANYMDRHIKYRARTAYFDIKDPDTTLKLRAWPIGLTALGVPIVDIYNDTTRPPTYPDALTYQEDYDVYPEEEEQGKIEFEYALLVGYKALKVDWTGGMATKTEVIGADGDTTVGATLTSATSTFITDLIEANMTVTITAGADAGTYTIASVDTENQITITGAWPVGAAGQSFRIVEGGFVGQYPDIEQALLDQIIFHWKRQHQPDIKGMSLNVGMQVTFWEPLALLTNVKKILDQYTLVEYP